MILKGLTFSVESVKRLWLVDFLSLWHFPRNLDSFVVSLQFVQSFFLLDFINIGLFNFLDSGFGLCLGKVLVGKKRILIWKNLFTNSKLFFHFNFWLAQWWTKIWGNLTSFGILLLLERKNRLNSSFSIFSERKLPFLMTLETGKRIAVERECFLGMSFEKLKTANFSFKKAWLVVWTASLGSQKIVWKKFPKIYQCFLLTVSELTLWRKRRVLFLLSFQKT